MIPATLGGRCANGYERDQGKIVHAVTDHYAYQAICGRKAGPRSVGFVSRPDLKVTCPKCIKCLTRLP